MLGKGINISKIKFKLVLTMPILINLRIVGHPLSVFTNHVLIYILNFKLKLKLHNNNNNNNIIIIIIILMTTLAFCKNSKSKDLWFKVFERLKK
jgi:hypothetical protein